MENSDMDTVLKPIDIFLYKWKQNKSQIRQKQLSVISLLILV